MKGKNLCLVICVLIVGFSMALVGCGTTQAQKGATGGGAIGAMVGGVLGGWEGAAIGAAVGGGTGYIIGNEQDKKAAKRQAERDRAELNKARVSKDPGTAYRPPNRNPLVGSTWRVLSIVSEKPVPAYSSMVVTFQTNSKITTLTVLKNGETKTEVESYRVVDDVLVITGKDYMINAKYSIEGKQMIIVAPEIRIVMEEIEENV